MNIPEIWLKIKSSSSRGVGAWTIPLVVILVALASFGMGRLSVLQQARPQIRISQGAAAAVAIPLGGYVVASKTGHVYFFPWCGGAAAMDIKNQLWFKSEDAAEKAGYVAAKNCKGLTDEE